MHVNFRASTHHVLIYAVSLYGNGYGTSITSFLRLAH